MNKRTLKIIKVLSENLHKPMYRAALLQTKITGEDCILSGTKEIEGKEVVPENEYYVKMPLNREVDHKQRMKKAFARRGKVGLITYLKPFIIPEKYGEVQVFIMKNCI